MLKACRKLAGSLLEGRQDENACLEMGSRLVPKTTVDMLIPQRSAN